MSPETQTSAATKSVADPAPLGLAAFAMTTFVLSVHNAQIGTTSAVAGAATLVLALALVYGGIAQILAGMWEFLRKNTFGALAFTSFGSFWLSYFVFAHFLVPTMSAAQVAPATGLFLMGWTIFTAYMTIASVRVSAAVATVFVLLTLTFLALTIGAYSGTTVITQIGGYLGLLTAIAAWYASCAEVVNETFGRIVLPTRARGSAPQGSAPTFAPHPHGA